MGRAAGSQSAGDGRLGSALQNPGEEAQIQPPLFRSGFFFSILKSGVQRISTVRDVLSVSNSLCWGPISPHWLLTAHAETFGAIQRAPSADFLPRCSQHQERPFEDSKNVACFIN